MWIKFTWLFFLVWALLGCGPERWPHGTIEWRDRHGVRVAPNGFTVDRAEFAQVVEDALVRWEKLHGKVVRDVIRDLWYPDKWGDFDTRVFFQPYPFEHKSCPLHATLRKRLCAGLTLPPKLLLVGYRTPLSTTALAHELGHIIYYNVFSTWVGVHEYMQTHGLE